MWIRGASAADLGRGALLSWQIRLLYLWAGWIFRRSTPPCLWTWEAFWPAFLVGWIWGALGALSCGALKDRLSLSRFRHDIGRESIDASDSALLHAGMPCVLARNQAALPFAPRKRSVCKPPCNMPDTESSSHTGAPYSCVAVIRWSSLTYTARCRHMKLVGADLQLHAMPLQR